MNFFCRMFHLKGLRHKLNIFLVNHIFAGTHHFEKKRKLLNKIGVSLGEGTKVVGPIYVTGNLIVEKNSWIGKDFTINGNGTVKIGDNCDIAPQVSFQTGGHLIGKADRRAGEGVINNQTVGNGTWICAQSTIVNNINIGNSCVIAARACVVKNVPDNLLVGGVPAVTIRELNI